MSLKILTVHGQHLKPGYFYFKYIFAVSVRDSVRPWRAVKSFENAHSIFLFGGNTMRNDDFIFNKPAVFNAPISNQNAHTGATTPESIFLENNPSINHYEMIENLCARTLAMVDCLHYAIENKDNALLPETIAGFLWQVTGNLEQIQKVNDHGFVK